MVLLVATIPMTQSHSLLDTPPEAAPEPSSGSDISVASALTQKEVDRLRQLLESSWPSPRSYWNRFLPDGQARAYLGCRTKRTRATTIDVSQRSSSATTRGHSPRSPLCSKPTSACGDSASLRPRGE